MPKLYTPRDAAQVLGIGYSTLKQWIYQGKLKPVQTAGGHHRVPEPEVDRLLPRIAISGTLEKRRRTFRRISGRNQLVGRVTDIKINGLLAQVTLSIGGQFRAEIFNLLNRANFQHAEPDYVYPIGSVGIGGRHHLDVDHGTTGAVRSEADLVAVEKQLLRR